MRTHPIGPYVSAKKGANPAGCGRIPPCHWATAFFVQFERSCPKPTIHRSSEHTIKRNLMSWSHERRSTFKLVRAAQKCQYSFQIVRGFLNTAVSVWSLRSKQSRHGNFLQLRSLRRLWDRLIIGFVQSCQGLA